MKKIFLTMLAVLVCVSAAAKKQKKEPVYNENGDIIKTGLNFGPLPAIAFDADRGFQYGAILNIYNYGDGHNYPNYDSKLYFEYSRFTKGSQLFQTSYDDKELIPGVRWSSALRINMENAFDFYGFGGYSSIYDYNRIGIGTAKGGPDSDYAYHPFYRMKRYEYVLRSDFIGRITPHLNWEAGVFVRAFQHNSIDYANINKGKTDPRKVFPETTPTLYEIYRIAGIIENGFGKGGLNAGFRLGMEYDTRDKEGAPTRGIWAEAHVSLAPHFMATTFDRDNRPADPLSKGYYRYSLTWRHYLPIINNDVLTFAYRLNYEGTFGRTSAFYALPFMTNMGEKNDADGMGGYGTCRGVIRDRAVGLDNAAYTAEFRWRFVRFQLWKQNIAFALNFFSDGAMAVRTFEGIGTKLGFDTSGRLLMNTVNEINGKLNEMGFEKDYYLGLLKTDSETGLNHIYNNRTKDIPHITCGVGLRFIMNENFIVAFEYGMPVSRFYSKNNPYRMQDGTGAFYVNLNYLF